MLTPNRIVAFLTPLVFAPAAGAVAALAADIAPGLNLSQERLTNVFIAGALVALAPALQWLHGWQKHEEREAETQRAIELANLATASAMLEPSSPMAPPFDDAADEGLDDEDLDALDRLEAEGEDLLDDGDDPLLALEDDDRAPAGV